MSTIYEKEYLPVWSPVNWDSLYISNCTSILENLSSKEIGYIHAYFWQGNTEKEIAPVLGFAGQSSVQVFKERVFAKIRMYMTKKLLFYPICLRSGLKKADAGYYKFFCKLQNSTAINKIVDDEGCIYIIANPVSQLQEYINSQLKTCFVCHNRHKCQKILNIEKRKSAKQNIAKILQIQDLTLEKNLKLHKKVLDYLISWRVFSNASNKKSV